VFSLHNTRPSNQNKSTLPTSFTTTHQLSPFQFLQVNLIQLLEHNTQSKATSSLIPRCTRKFERKWIFGLRFESGPKSHRTRQRPRTRHGNPVPIAIYLCDIASHCTALYDVVLHQPTQGNQPTDPSIHPSINQSVHSTPLTFPSLSFPSPPELPAAPQEDDCSCVCSRRAEPTATTTQQQQDGTCRANRLQEQRAAVLTLHNPCRLEATCPFLSFFDLFVRSCGGREGGVWVLLLFRASTHATK
jgi:hypothetical protein